MTDILKEKQAKGLLNRQRIKKQRDFIEKGSNKERLRGTFESHMDLISKKVCIALVFEEYLWNTRGLEKRREKKTRNQLLKKWQTITRTQADQVDGNYQ